MSDEWELSEEEWQLAGAVFAASLPPLPPRRREDNSVAVYVEAHFRAAKRAAAKPKGKYNPLTRRRY